MPKETNSAQKSVNNNPPLTNSKQQIFNRTYQPSTTNNQLNNREKAKVIYVFDGDTIELSDKRRIRYIGINTPELNSKLKIKPECYATKSAEINKQLVLNQEIEMEKDQTDKDLYGRYIRYIWIDDVFINDFLVRQGFARVENIPPDTKYSKDFKEAQAEAKNDNRGLWGECQ